MKNRLNRTSCLMTSITVVCGVWSGFANFALGIQQETHEEKEANLKGQALGGLFQRWTFDQQNPNEIPAGFMSLSLGEDPAPVWAIQVDAEAPSAPNSLRGESGCRSVSCYRLLVAEKLEYEYPDVSVRMRFPAEGHVGQGGIVIGLQNASNFYAGIVDVASRKLELVRVIDGRVTLLGQMDINPKPVEWHTLRILRNTIISKDVIEAFFDGSLVLSLQDQSLGIGQVGLVVHGKSSLHFDSLHAIPLFSQRPLSAPAAY